MLESIILYFKANGLEYLGTVAGILGVWFSIKEKIVTWPTFIICYTVYVYLAFEAGLLANMSLNILFIVLSAYGWWQWKQVEEGSSTEGTKAIQHTSRKLWIINVLFWIIGTVVIGYLLESYTQSFQPYLDAFATSVAFSAQWMLSKKYIGTWLCWLISDTIFINLWALQGYWVTVFLFFTFMVLAIYGWRQWHQTLTKAEQI
jgi:nicotinamide mononucleotide transporter